MRGVGAGKTGQGNGAQHQGGNGGYELVHDFISWLIVWRHSHATSKRYAQYAAGIRVSVCKPS